MKRVVLVLLFVLASFPLFAQGPGPGAGPGPEGQRNPSPALNEIKTYLALTDAQIQSFQQIRRSQAPMLRPQMEQLRQKQQEMQQLLQQGGNATAVGQLMTEIEALRKQLETSHAQMRDQLLNVLTADQKAKLKTLEDAAKLRPAIQGATALGLLGPQEWPAGIRAPRARGAEMGAGPRAAQGRAAGLGPRARALRP